MAAGLDSSSVADWLLDCPAFEIEDRALFKYPGQGKPAPADENQPGKPTHRITSRKGFLEEDQERDGTDPDEIHQSTDEQEGHKHPAAAEAKKSVANPGSDSAEHASLPVSDQERGGRATMPKACIL